MDETSLYSGCLPSGKEIVHGLCPSKVMTGVRIDLFFAAPGCDELEAITVVFARLVGKYIG
jgi:hypothetical protein